jgi:hypothetical protein
MKRNRRRKATTIKAVPSAEKNDVANSNEAERDNEGTRTVYAWPSTLRGHRFVLNAGIFGIATILIFGFTFLVFGPFGSGIASILLGVFGGIIVNTIEKEQGVNYKLAIPWTPQSWVGITFFSILIFQVIDLIVRLWLLPWRLAYGPSFNTSTTAIIGILACDFGGLILSGVLIGRLMPTRALTAAIIGASLYTGMNLVEAYTGVAAFSNYSFIASYMNLDLGADAYQSFRLGLVIGLITRGLIAVLIARYVAKRRIKKGLVYGVRGGSVSP